MFLVLLLGSQRLCWELSGRPSNTLFQDDSSDSEDFVDEFDEFFRFRLMMNWKVLSLLRVSLMISMIDAGYFNQACEF